MRGERGRYIQSRFARQRGHVAQQLLHRAQQVLCAAIGATDLAVAHQQTQLQEERVDAFLSRGRRRVEGRRREVARGGRREEGVGEEAVEQLLGLTGLCGFGSVGRTLRGIGSTLCGIGHIPWILHAHSNTLRTILDITRCHSRFRSLLLSLGRLLRLLRPTQRLLLFLCQVLIRLLLCSDFCHSHYTRNQTLLRGNVNRLARRLRDRLCLLRRQLCLHFRCLLRLLCSA